MSRYFHIQGLDVPLAAGPWADPTITGSFIVQLGFEIPFSRICQPDAIGGADRNGHSGFDNLKRKPHTPGRCGGWINSDWDRGSDVGEKQAA